jgi:hypothetical protein
MTDDPAVQSLVALVCRWARYDPRRVDLELQAWSSQHGRAVHDGSGARRNGAAGRAPQRMVDASRACRRRRRRPRLVERCDEGPPRNSPAEQWSSARWAVGRKRVERRAAIRKPMCARLWTLLP